MPGWHALGGLALASAAVTGTPGPSNLSLLAAGATFGIRRCRLYLLGTIGGTLLVLAAVATGVTALLRAAPVLAPLALVAGALYILWLAYHIAAAPPLAAAAGAGGRAPSWAGGMLIGIANPKAWIALAAVLVTARLSGSGLLAAGVKVGMVAVMVCAASATWLTAGRAVAPLFSAPRRARVINVCLAVALLAATALAIWA
ncbi:MAG: LysE family transporter [Candidatus Dormibacteraeota bacterium]|nr:LysE family transporter [Candidatus Dormibacteraeota bacterium]